MIPIIESDLLSRFPNYAMGIFGPVSAAFKPDKLATALESLQIRALSPQARQRVVHVINHWREVYTSMGASPRYLSSLESLAQRLDRDGTLPSIHPLVDLYNWLSLAAPCPMAAYDFDKISGQLVLRTATKGEAFTPLGCPLETQRTKAREVVYADSQGVICRYWNYRDCHATRVTSETKNMVFIADIVDLPKAAMDDCVQVINDTLQPLFFDELHLWKDSECPYAK